MTDIITTLRERAPRYKINSGADLTIVVEKEGWSSRRMTAELVDISISGAKLKVFEAIVIADDLTITLESCQRRQSIVVSCQVCRVTPTAGNVWLIGCSFKPSIPEEVLHELAEANILERREYPRERVALKTTALQEMVKEASTVSLVNYSRGGFCLLSQQSSKPGVRTMLRIESDGRTIEVPGTIRWQFDCHDGYIIGCEFLDSGHFKTLSRLAESQMPTKSLLGSFVATHQTQTVEANDEPAARRRCLRHAFGIGTFGLLVLLGTLLAKNWTEDRHTFNDPIAVYDNVRQLPRSTTEVPATCVAKVETARNDESIEKPAQLGVSGSEYRKWVDNTGRFSVTARVVEVVDDTVQLETENGRQISVPLTRLNADGTRYVRLLAEDLE